MELESHKNSKDPIDEIDPQRYWLIFKRRWVPATTVFSLFFLPALYLALSQPSNYLAQGQILFQRRDLTSTLTGINDKLSELDVANSTNPLLPYLQTQSVVLRSSPILLQTIKALNLREKNGDLVKLEDFSKRLSIEIVTGADVLEISYQSSNAKESAKVVNYLMNLYLSGNIRVNRLQASSAKNFLADQIPLAEVTLTKASEDLRRFKKQYQVASVEDELKATVDQMSLLEDQLNKAQTQLADASSRSKTVQNQLGLYTHQAIDLSTLSQNPSIQQTLVDLQAIQTELSKQGQLYTTTHPLIKDLRLQEENLQLLLDDHVRKIIGSKIPFNRQTFDEGVQMGELKQQLTANLANIEGERLGLQQQVRAIEVARKSYAQKLNAFPDLEKMEGLLQERLKAAQTNYETLLAKGKETELAENQTIGNARILEDARIPEKTIGSGRLKILAAGGAIGFLLGIATAFLFDLMDKSVKTAKDAEALFGFTLLGLIPQFKSFQKDISTANDDDCEKFSPRIITLNDPHCLASAAYQMLQANLRFLSSDKEVRAIVVTSAVAEEGKTEVAANLAATLALAGRRVLLVDADMRSPSQHHLWNVINAIGLSHVLVGVGVIDQALKSELPNLTIMTAGVTPPNPLALIDSETMMSLMKNFLDSFDYVILDTPSLTDAADAAILGKIADGVLIVVRPRVATSAAVVAAKNLLSRSNAKVLGLVANAIQVKNEHEEYTSFTQQRVIEYSKVS